MKKIVIGTFLSSSLLLSACTMGASAEEQLSDALAKVYQEEKGYRDAQQQLADMEEKEQLTFNSTMELTQEQKEEVSSKVKELKASLSDRIALLKEENQSIDQAESSLSAIDSLIEEAKEEEKSALSELKSLMEARYEAHDVVSKEYQKLTDLQNELYDMLGNEETEQAQLQEQVGKVNEQSELVQSFINAFNEETKKVNEAKSAVYDSMKDEK